MSMEDDNKPSVFIVDDEIDVLQSLTLVFESNGYKVLAASTGKSAVEMFGNDPVPVIVCDYSLPDTQGMELFRKFNEILPDSQMIIMTGRGTIDLAVKAMKAGVFDFLTKPVDPDHLLQLVMRARQLYDALSAKKTLLEEVERFVEQQDIIGGHPSIKQLLRLIDNVAPTDSTVLIEGESGTGKELVARLIHKKSHRSRGPFVAVDSGAIPEGLVESELFGHEKGAFTGAIGSKPGKFERANNGTLFLDEITNLPLGSQVKLLRALQEKVIDRVGAQKLIPVNIRLIAATNVSLQEAVKEKKFREDLYYRLNIIRVKIPPLRERKSDTLALSLHFIKKLKERIDTPVTGISKEALKIMMDYSWPGNVRELENTIEHALIMSRSAQIKPNDLPPLEGIYYKASSDSSFEPSVSRIDEAERQMLIAALKEAGGNKYKAAKMLGIPRSSLYSKLKKFGMPIS